MNDSPANIAAYLKHREMAFAAIEALSKEPPRREATEQAGVYTNHKEGKPCNRNFTKAFSSAG